MRSVFMRRMAAGVACALLAVGAPFALPAQEAESRDAAESPQSPAVDQQAATDAFNQLFASAEQRLRDAGPRLKAVRREVIGELEAFAKQYPGTAAAAVSLENAGSLAGAIGELDRAEAMFREALLHRPPQDIYQRIAYGLSDLIARTGREVRDYTAVTVDGRDVSPAAMKGKVVLLDFWATWCGPCIAELPHLKQAYSDYHDQGFEIVSISLDSDREAMTRFIRENQMTWTHVFDEDRPMEQRLADRFGVYGIPHTILVGKDGRIVAHELRGAALGEAVKRALNAAPALP